MNGSSRSFVSAIRGPIMLITVGGLFALNNFTPYGFNSTWPVLLIVFGLLTLLARGTAPAAPAGGPQPPYPASYAPPFEPAGPGGYRQSSYNQPPAGPQTPAGTVKGGFGTSAPQRAGEQGSAPPPESGGGV
ncbi:MAG: DUF5668 domain-containing protein [Acidobacteriia bacterium]|nr:DUF5668 domain-containing protein [Terriglobia bacterium]